MVFGLWALKKGSNYVHFLRERARDYFGHESPCVSAPHSHSTRFPEFRQVELKFGVGTTNYVGGDIRNIL